LPLFLTVTFFKQDLTVIFQKKISRYFSNIFWPLFFKYFSAVIFQIFFSRYFSYIFKPLFFKYFSVVIFQIFFNRYFSNNLIIISKFLAHKFYFLLNIFTRKNALLSVTSYTSILFSY